MGEFYICFVSIFPLGAHCPDSRSGFVEAPQPGSCRYKTLLDAVLLDHAAGLFDLHGRRGGGRAFEGSRGRSVPLPRPVKPPSTPGSRWLAADKGPNSHKSRRFFVCFFGWRRFFISAIASVMPLPLVRGRVGATAGTSDESDRKRVLRDGPPAAARSSVPPEESGGRRAWVAVGVEEARLVVANNTRHARKLVIGSENIYKKKYHKKNLKNIMSAGPLRCRSHCGRRPCACSPVLLRIFIGEIMNGPFVGG